jgi:uncharacterized FlaG/YvyC family protein
MEVTVGEVPEEMRRELDAAARRVDDLAAVNRELDFRIDPCSGRVVVSVRDLRGTVIRHITPAEALDIMSGLSDA